MNVFQHKYENVLMSFVLKTKVKTKLKSMNLILKNLVCREEPKFLKSEINYKGLDHYFLINIMSKIFSPWHTVLKAVKGLFNVSECVLNIFI